MSRIKRQWAESQTELRALMYSIIWRELEYDGDDFSGHLADTLINELNLIVADKHLWPDTGQQEVLIEGFFEEPITNE